MFIYFLNREYGRRTLGEEIIELIQRSSRKYLVALFKSFKLSFEYYLSTQNLSTYKLL